MHSTTTEKEHDMYYVMLIHWDGSEEQVAICITEDMAKLVAQALRDSDTYLNAQRYVVV